MNGYDATEQAYKNGKRDGVREFAERVEETTWYHINAKGELVIGANSETNVPLYKAEDIYQIAKEMLGERSEK